MNKLFFLMVVITAVTYGQDLRENATFSLFSDYKGIKLGDAITVIVLESTEASNEAEKSIGRTSDLSFSAKGTLDKTALPTVDLGVASKNQFDGGGSSKAGGVVRTKMTCTIDSVLANGNVRIKGSRKIVVNNEEQILKIKGYVRTTDIQTDNSVYSYNISDAEIIFEGEGNLNKNTEPGLLAKLFHLLF